jgi:hypothetical protein
MKERAKYVRAHARKSKHNVSVRLNEEESKEGERPPLEPKQKRQRTATQV